MTFASRTAAASQLIFIDPSLPEPERLSAGLPAHAERHWLDPQAALLPQLAAALEGRHGLQALHLFCHGTPGRLLLGQHVVDQARLAQDAAALRTIGAAMAATGCWLLYGCDVARGGAGHDFVAGLSRASGLAILAATHPVGCATQGGHWDLDFAHPASAPEQHALPAGRWQSQGLIPPWGQPLRAPGWAHVLNGTPGRVLPAIDEDTPASSISGATVSSLFAADFSGSNGQAFVGVALTQLPVTTGQGQWQAQASPGADWQPLQIPEVLSTSFVINDLRTVATTSYGNGLQPALMTAGGGGLSPAGLSLVYLAGPAGPGGLDLFDSVNSTNYLSPDFDSDTYEAGSAFAGYAAVVGFERQNVGAQFQGEYTVTVTLSAPPGTPWVIFCPMYALHQAYAGTEASVSFTLPAVGRQPAAGQGLIIAIPGAEGSAVKDLRITGMTYTGLLKDSGGQTSSGSVAAFTHETAAAVFLPESASLRFVPEANFNGTVPTLSAQLLGDTASGNLNYAPLGSGLSSSALALQTPLYASVELSSSITPVNDAPTFAPVTGTVLTNIGAYEVARKSWLLADGKLLVLGSSGSGDASQLALLRYTRDGVLDDSFGDHGRVLTDLTPTDDEDYSGGFALLVQPDGKILVAGTADAGYASSAALLRYTADGSLDASFGSGGVALSSIERSAFYGLALAGDGSILAAGQVEGTRLLVTRHTAAGAADTTIGNNGDISPSLGSYHNSIFHTAITLAGGATLLAGTARKNSGVSDILLARYTANGELDYNFGGSNPGLSTNRVSGLNSASEHMAVDGEGRILVVGEVDDQAAVLRYLPDGSLDGEFGGGDGWAPLTLGQSTRIMSVLALADGKLLVAGSINAYDSIADDYISQIVVARLDGQSGALDSSFGNGGSRIIASGQSGKDSAARHLAVQADGKIVLVGYANNESDFAVVRLHANGSLDTGFGSPVNTLGGTVQAMLGGAPVVIDSDVVLSDPDLDALADGAGNYAGLTLQLARQGGANPADVFAAKAGGTLSLENGEISLDGNIIGSLSNAAGSLNLTFNAAAQSAAVSSVLRQLTYSNLGSTPGSVTLEWSANDHNTGSQGGSTSLTGIASSTVVLSLAPSFDLSPNDNSSKHHQAVFTLGGTAVAFTQAGNNFSGPETPTQTGFRFSVPLAQLSSGDTLVFAGAGENGSDKTFDLAGTSEDDSDSFDITLNDLSYEVSYRNNGDTLRFTVEPIDDYFTLAEIEALVDALKFSTTSSSTGDRVFSLYAYDDDDGETAIVTFTATVSAASNNDSGNTGSGNSGSTPPASGGSDNEAPTSTSVTSTTPDGGSITTSTSTRSDGAQITQTSTLSGSGIRTTDTQTRTPDGKLEQEFTVAPIPASHSQAAELGLYFGNQEKTQPITTASLPGGVGLASSGARTPANHAQALADLISLIDRTAGSSEPGKSGLLDGGSAFLQTLEQQASLGPLIINALTLSQTVVPGTPNAPNAPNAPIVITGTSRPVNVAGSGGSGLPVEALVIDTRGLPAHSTLLLQNIEFAAIIGDQIMVRGGEGSNTVFAGAGSQFIVLGADDDELHGGDGNDTVASKGGNDRLFGDAGNDSVIGGIGNDQLYGGDGDDLLQGGASDAGTWDFSLNAAGELVARFTPTDTDLADLTDLAAPLSLSGRWTRAETERGQIDARFALAEQDYSKLADIALLYQACIGQRPELASLNAISAQGSSATELAGQAYALFLRDPAATTEHAAMSSLLTRVWGSADPALVQLGVTYLAEGGSWGAVLLALVRHASFHDRQLDATGGLPLSRSQVMGETGWSANAGNDQLFGGAGNDVLVGGNGNNLLDGGAGIDMAVLFGVLADYQISWQASNANDGALILRNRHSGDTNQLLDIEFLKIGGQIYAPKPGLPTLASGSEKPVSDFLQLIGQAELQAAGAPASWISG